MEVGSKLVCERLEFEGKKFYTPEYIDSYRNELKRQGIDKVLFACGPWVGELGFELNYWSPFLRFMKKEMYPEDEYFIYSFPDRYPLYMGLGKFEGMKHDFVVSVANQLGPNALFSNQEDQDVFLDFLSSAWKVAKEKDIEYIIVILPSSKLGGIVLGAPNDISDYLLSRMNFDQLDSYLFVDEWLEDNVCSSTKIEKDNFAVIFPSVLKMYPGKTWDEKNWEGVINHITNDLNIGVLSLGSRYLNERMEGTIALSITNNKKFYNPIYRLLSTPNDNLSLQIGMLKRAKFVVCSSFNSACLSLWCGANVIFLCDQDISYTDFVGLFQKVIDLNKLELVYGETIDSIEVERVIKSIDVIVGRENDIKKN